MQKDEEQKHASSLKKWRKAADIVWNIFLNGVLSFLFYMVVGILLCCTLVGIPFLPSFYRYAAHLFTPANSKMVETREVKGFMAFMTLLFDVLFGWELWLLCYLFGALCYCSIIYIPIAQQLFHQAHFFFNPRAYVFEPIAYQGVIKEEKPSKPEAVEEAPKAPAAKPVLAEANALPVAVTSPKEEKEATSEKKPIPVVVVQPTPKAKLAPAPAKKEPAPANVMPRPLPKGPLIIQYITYGGKPQEKGPYADWANKKWY